MKKTIHVYPFFEKTKGLKYVFILCAFAFSMTISSSAFSQNFQSVTMANPNAEPAALEFLTNITFDVSDVNQVSSALKSEHRRLLSSSVISADEVSVKTFLIEAIHEPITNQVATVEQAFSNAYPSLLEHVNDNNIQIDNLDEFVLDIATLLE